MLSTISKDNLTARIKKMMVAKEVVVQSKGGTRWGAYRVRARRGDHLGSRPKKEKTRSPCSLGSVSFGWERSKGPNLTHPGTRWMQLKVNTSLWDPNFDSSAHNKLCYLMEDDISFLNKLGVGRLCGDVENLLGQVTTLVCLTYAKLKEGECNGVKIYILGMVLN